MDNAVQRTGLRRPPPQRLRTEAEPQWYHWTGQRKGSHVLLKLLVEVYHLLSHMCPRNVALAAERSTDNHELRFTLRTCLPSTWMCEAWWQTISEGSVVKGPDDWHHLANLYYGKELLTNADDLRTLFFDRDSWLCPLLLLCRGGPSSNDKQFKRVEVRTDSMSDDLKKLIQEIQPSHEAY